MFTDDKYSIQPLKALGIFAYLFLATASPETLLAATDRCTTVIPLTAGETWRDPGRSATESVCFDLNVETPGILALDVVTSDLGAVPSAPRARLAFDGPGLLRQSPTSLVAASPSGTYRARVESDEPGQPLPPFRLASRFSAPAAKSETDSETEVEPDPFAACGAKSETDSETEVEPDPLAHDLSRLPGVFQAHLGELCRQESIDDHGDSFLCATALAEDEAVGELANDWGDDVDVFRFQLKTLAPIAIDVRGEVELAVALYDRHGLQLATAGEGDRLRLTRTLVPGTYYVRLTGLDGSSGSYSIRLAF